MTVNTRTHTELTVLQSRWIGIADDDCERQVSWLELMDTIASRLATCRGIEWDPDYLEHLAEPDADDDLDDWLDRHPLGETIVDATQAVAALYQAGLIDPSWYRYDDQTETLNARIGSIG